jgi:internalin A
VGDAGLARLVLLTGLKELYLSSTLVGGAGLQRLAGLKIHLLSLSGNQLSDADVAPLAGLPDLESLFLDDNRVTDAGLASLAGLAHLERLDLQQNPVTDVGLVHLRGLSRLSQLEVSDTRVTSEGLKKLKAFLPNLRLP